MTAVFAGTASAETAKSSAQGQSSWMNFSGTSSGGANASGLEPMTKEEEEAMKKYLLELQKAISAVQGARAASQTAALTSQASQLRVLNSMNSLRSIPRPQDLQVVRDVQSATVVTEGLPPANLVPPPVPKQES